jgi:hypothetical protein
MRMNPRRFNGPAHGMIEGKSLDGFMAAAGGW